MEESASDRETSGRRSALIRATARADTPEQLVHRSIGSSLTLVRDKARASSTIRRSLSEKRWLAAAMNRQEIARQIAAIDFGLAMLTDKGPASWRSVDIPLAYRKLQADIDAAIERVEAAIRSIADDIDIARPGARDLLIVSDDPPDTAQQQQEVREAEEIPTWPRGFVRCRCAGRRPDGLPRKHFAVCSEAPNCDASKNVKN